MQNRKVRLNETEYDVICVHRKNIGKDYISKDDIKIKYRTRLSDDELSIINDMRHKPIVISDINNVLVIGDLHAPFTKFGYLEFCKAMYYKYKCNQVVFIGDLLDNHFSSFHDTDPDGMGGREELYKAKTQIAEFYKAFPKAKVVLGNHDRIPARKAFSNNLSSSWIKTIDEVLDVPNWEFAEEFIIDGVLYTHGEGRQARNRVQQELISVVQGHWHSKTYYETFASERQFLFAMQVGCGIDRKSYAAAYARHFQKPQINVGIVMDNGRWGLIEHMNMN